MLFIYLIAIANYIAFTVSVDIQSHRRVSDVKRSLAFKIQPYESYVRSIKLYKERPQHDARLKQASFQRTRRTMPSKNEPDRTGLISVQSTFNVDAGEVLTFHTPKFSSNSASKRVLSFEMEYNIWRIN